MRGWLVPLCVAVCLCVGAPAAASPAVPDPALPDPALPNAALPDPALLDSAVPDTDEPPAAAPANLRFAHHVLRPGTARRAGLLPEPVAGMRAVAESYLAPTPDHENRPSYPGAVVLAAHDGIVVQRFAIGDAVRYSAPDAELPPDRRIPARPDTIYDLASVSKLFTTVVLLQLAEQGLVRLDAPVATYVPEFAAGGKAVITVRDLLTHTSGLPSFRPFYSSYPTPETRLAAALATPVTAGTSPGAQYVYSDIGLIALGVLIERVTGTSLPDNVHARITEPLSMTDTLYRPPAALRERIAATEFQGYAGRGMVWGEVHDENAWGLGGAAGHAGLFATADDLAVFAQMLLNGGVYRGHRVLSEPMVRQALVNYNAGLEERFPDSDRGLGFELNKHLYMGAMASPVTFGHTGFTGTSLVIDPIGRSFLIILSNRVHPDRGWGTNTAARHAIAHAFADAHPVRPVFGGAAWRTERRDASTVTLTAPLRRPVTGRAVVSFLLWYDTEPHADSAIVQTSADGVTWAALPLTLRSGGHRFTTDGSLTGYGGRRWWQATAALPAGATALRWSYRTDASVQGRGVYVDHPLAADRRGPLLVAGDRLTADGWRRSRS